MSLVSRCVHTLDLLPSVSVRVKIKFQGERTLSTTIDRVRRLHSFVRSFSVRLFSFEYICMANARRPACLARLFELLLSINIGNYMSLADWARHMSTTLDRRSQAATRRCCATDLISNLIEMSSTCCRRGPSLSNGMASDKISFGQENVVQNARESSRIRKTRNEVKTNGRRATRRRCSLV
jgi:hypothetical protein